MVPPALIFLGHPHPQPPGSQVLRGLGFKAFPLQLQLRKPGHKTTLGQQVGCACSPRARWGTEAPFSPPPSLPSPAELQYAPAYAVRPCPWGLKRPWTQ